MSAFTRMADSYEEVEAENGQLHMQVRKLKAQNAELLAALERIAKGGWHTVTPASSIANEAIAKAKGW